MTFSLPFPIPPAGEAKNRPLKIDLESIIDQLNTAIGASTAAGTANTLAYYTSATAIGSLTAITGSRALVSNASGLPVAATTTSTEIGYVNGVTSAIQTQIDTKAANSLAFVTIGNTGSLSAERALTGTSNQIVVTDNGANSTVVLSTPQNIDVAATPTFASLSLTAVSNQLVLGSTRTATITAPTPATSSRTYTFPDLTGNYDVVATIGAQTIAGSKTFSSAVNITATSNQIVLPSDTSSRTFTLTTVTGPAASRTYTIPDAGAAASFVMTEGTQTINGNKTFGGTILQTAQPSFLVTDGTGATDVTGDGTSYTELWPTEIFDQGSNFASNTFTAPVTGRYALQMSVGLANLLTTHTTIIARIITSNRNYTNQIIYPVTGTAERLLTQNVAVIADMDVNDTATVDVTIVGGTKTVDIENNAALNYFSGSLIN